MASPQCSNGYTKLANELLEALCRTRLNGECMMVFLTIARMSYGYSKKVAELSLGKIAEITRLDRRNVNRAKKRLIAMNMIIQHKIGMLNSYSINKNYEQWRGDIKTDVTFKCRQKRRQSDVNIDDKTDVNSDDTHIIKKERKLKENIYTAFFKEIWQRYPNKIEKSKALKAFSNTVKSEKAWREINMALDNYLDHLKVEKWKKPKNGATWFRGWRDWIDYLPESMEEKGDNLHKMR